MKKKKLFKVIAAIGITGALIAGGLILYLFNMPHRDVQSAEADYRLTSTGIVTEYLTNPQVANEKYLSADGDSRILEITGKVAKISEDFNGNKVVLLKSNGDKAGVSATFTPETNQYVDDLVRGQEITLKGVIRSGASYDEDLELYENVIIEKSNIISK